MAASTNGFDRLTMTKVAFGIRFQNQFGLEDHLGAVLDDILASPNFGPERFEETIYTPETRQITSTARDETITLTRADAILQTSKGPFALDELPNMGNDFIEVVWAAVCKRALRPPSIIRYGCMVSFPLPATWNPIQTMLNAEPEETSEFDLRYVRRIASERGLASKGIHDYRNAIYHLQVRKREPRAMLDFQHVFEPSLGSEKARKDQPYTRFVEKAIAYFRVNGWDFIKSRVERLSHAA